MTDSERFRKVRKVGPNEPCPCGLLKKYKQCCRGKVDWETLPLSNPDTAVRHLSTRGKNRLFCNAILDALQLDNETAPVDRLKFKRAFTAAAVKKIYEALPWVWPDGEDLKRTLRQEADQTSGLYIGMYDPDLVRRGVTRHSLYADRILLIDPLIHPLHAVGELNPLLHPEMHRTSTLQWVSLWISMLPWINSGIVGFVRAPGDFYPDILRGSTEAIQARFSRHPELTDLVRQHVEEEKETERYRSQIEQIMLTMPNSQIRKMTREERPTWTETQIDAVVDEVQRERDAHPYCLGREHSGERYHEIFYMTTGTNYEQAKLIAMHTNSYVMTDLGVRWREIELDRAESGIDTAAWSPFAKAFQGLQFSFLDAVPLSAALEIRQEGRLESLRHFLRKIWDATAKTKPFDDENIPALAAELDEKVREADAEWRQIDRDLLKLVAAEASAGILAAGPLVTSGHAVFVGAAAVLVGAANLAGSRMRRNEYKLKYPAGFFVDLKKGSYAE